MKTKQICPTPIGFFRDITTEKMHPARCNRWSCQVCGKMKKAKLLDKISAGFSIDAKCRYRHLVLTEKKVKLWGSRGYEWKSRSILTHWARLRASLAKAGFPVEKFFWTKEISKDGNRHLHVIITKFIPKSVIKRLWFLATDKTAYIIKIKDHGIYSPAGYLAKYMTKRQFLEAQYEPFERRYGCSKGDFTLERPVRTSGIFVFYLAPNFFQIPTRDYLEWTKLDFERQRLHGSYI